jgi:hypothetical protein
VRFFAQTTFFILHSLGLEYRQRIGAEQQAGRQAPGIWECLFLLIAVLLGVNIWGFVQAGGGEQAEGVLF